MTEQVNCRWCSQPFSPLDVGQAYCTPEHTRLARIARKAAKPPRGTPERLALLFTPDGPRACEWCDGLFTPTAEEQKYCKPRHSKNARIARSKMRALEPGECPRPDKIAHKSQQAAERRLLRLRRSDLEWYQCNCGNYHIGHIYPVGHDLRGGNFTSPEAVLV